MGQSGPTKNQQAYLKSNPELIHPYPEKNVNKTESLRAMQHFNQKMQTMYSTMLSVPFQSRLQSYFSFPFSSSFKPAIAVFIVLCLFQNILITPCSAEPVVPRAARSSVIRPTRVTYGDIEKLNKTCPGKDTCAPSRNGKFVLWMSEQIFSLTTVLKQLTIERIVLVLKCI